jgi:uncharacterized protein YyaL (SSP411 family)
VPNRLASSTSPYLLQHKDNPVDWYEWGDEAFDDARRRGVPVLLSVGYAACHWCHVMAHESFEDEATAALMNASFVNVKVDREERPDVDAVYMEAVQAMTGQGGWPMTVLLTPDREPFYAGTYFPRAPAYGMPSLTQLLTAVTDQWQADREHVETAAHRIAQRLAERSEAVAAGAPSADDLAAAVARLAVEYDRTNGGFGGAPKFPPSLVVEQLLRHHARTGSDEALAMVEGTLTAMARGGIYDQLAGGFARYSVDAGWVVPHFEKMLYDNALLLRAYAHWWRATGSTLAARVVEETATFLRRDLSTAEGGFASALDADSDGVEGLTYVWTPGQLADVLGPDDGAWAAELFGMTDEATFERGASTLAMPVDPADPGRWAVVRERLLAARALRPQPARDDKVVAAWNGLAVAALADCGAIFGRADWVEAAREAADLLLRVHDPGGTAPSPSVVPGRLLRVSRNGVAGVHAGVLEDHGDVAEGLLALYAATGETRWLHRAGAVLDVVLDHFAAPDGGFFDTADDAEPLLRRPRDPADNAAPSGTSAVAGALLTYAAYTGSARHRTAAEQALAAYVPLAHRYPRFAGWALAVAEALADGPRELAVVAEPGDLLGERLRRVAALATAPGLAVAWGVPGEPGGVPLLSDRELHDGMAAAYVCRGFVCDLPTSDPHAMAAAVGARPASPVTSADGEQPVA